MKTILLVDDDMTFCQTLERALSKKGFEVKVAHRAEEALFLTREFNPEYVLVDLKMPSQSGLNLIPQLIDIDPYTRIVVLTGYASITTAVEAIKLGAIHYLAKPVTVDEIITAFDKKDGDPETPIEEQLPTVHQLASDYIRSVLERNGGNISATARELKMHRRTLQRKLQKH
ncbi:MAG: response regulator [Alphaproteobacteria bacterium]|nr:response regulator [Alphaproteobacteria bacterium]